MQGVREEKTALLEARQSGYTLLHQAAFHNSAEAAKTLLQAGAAPNVIAVGTTPLGLATLRGQESVVEELLRCPGVDIAARQDLERSGLHLAAVHGHAHIAWRLLQAGADPTASDCNKQTALHLAATHGQARVCLAILEFAAEKGRLLSTLLVQLDQHGRTALRCAVHKGDSYSCAFLLNYGADMRAEDNQKLTPLAVLLRLAKYSGVAHAGCFDAMLAAGEDQGLGSEALRRILRSESRVANEIYRIDHEPGYVPSLAQLARRIIRQELAAEMAAARPVVSAHRSFVALVEQLPVDSQSKSFLMFNELVPPAMPAKAAPRWAW